MVFNVDSCEAGVMELVGRTTRWILTEKVDLRLAEGKLEMPCKMESMYWDRSEGEQLLRCSRNEDGSRLARRW